MRTASGESPSEEITANADLHECELIKMTNLSAELTRVLQNRGIVEPDERLTAEAGIAVFRAAFAQWVGESERRAYAEIVNDSLARLRTLTNR